MPWPEPVAVSVSLVALTSKRNGSNCRASREKLIWFIDLFPITLWLLMGSSISYILTYPSYGMTKPSNPLTYWSVLSPPHLWSALLSKAIHSLLLNHSNLAIPISTIVFDNNVYKQLHVISMRSSLKAGMCYSLKVSAPYRVVSMWRVSCDGDLNLSGIVWWRNRVCVILDVSQQPTSNQENRGGVVWGMGVMLSLT